MKIKIMLLVATLALLCGTTALAQETSPDANAPAQEAGRARKVTEQNAETKTDAPQANEAKEPAAKSAETTVTDDSAATPTNTPAKTQEPRTQPASVEEAKVAPVYDDFFSTYRLGPEDVISVTVFGQERYSRANITIPPNGRISLVLIPGGVIVKGKTVEEVAEIIRQKYDEYIKDPQVDVSLDKAMSYRYSIIGDVAQPGIRPLSRQMTVREALAEAGGALNTGDTSKVAIIRKQSDGTLATVKVNVKKILQGKVTDDAYLQPGDQVFVPGNNVKKIDQIMKWFNIVSFARIFTGGF